MLSLFFTKLSQGSSFFVLKMMTSMIKRQFKKRFGGIMFKLFFMGVLVSMISDLSGIPIFPVVPVVSNNAIKFEVTSIDQVKYRDFKKYLSQKF